MNVYFGVFSRRRTRQIDFTVRALRQFRERQPHDPGEGTTCCPAPKSIANMNTSNVGRLGLSDAEEDALVLFMQTLTDGFMHYSRLDGPAVACLVHLRAETRLKPCSVVLRPTISAKRERLVFRPPLAQTRGWKSGRECPPCPDISDINLVPLFASPSASSPNTQV
jgi:hypothetical protein